MVTISIKEFKLITDIVKSLNEAFPPNEEGIPATRWSAANRLERFSRPCDPHFTAYTYAGDEKIWWLCVDNAGVWGEAYDYMKQFCEYLAEQGLNAHPSLVVPVFNKGRQDEHKQKKNTFFIGRVTW